MCHSVSALTEMIVGKILIQLIAAEDCGAQSLLKGQTPDLKEMGDDDEVWKQEHGSEDGEDHDDNKIEEPKLSDYERTKAKNITELKGILAALDEKYQIPKELQAKKVANDELVSKKDRKGKKITPRHLSHRNKDKIRNG